MSDRGEPFRVTTADAEAITEAMSPLAQRLVRILGFLPALDFIRHFGGRRKYIPRTRIRDDSKIVDVVGRAGADALAKQFGGTLLHVPLMCSVERLLRDNAIRSDYDNGATMCELVAHYKLHERTIRRLLATRPDVSPRHRPSKPRDWLPSLRAVAAPGG